MLPPSCGLNIKSQKDKSVGIWRGDSEGSRGGEFSGCRMHGGKCPNGTSLCRANTQYSQCTAPYEHSGLSCSLWAEGALLFAMRQGDGTVSCHARLPSFNSSSLCLCSPTILGVDGCFLLGNLGVLFLFFCISRWFCILIFYDIISYGFLPLTDMGTIIPILS